MRQCNSATWMSWIPMELRPLEGHPALPVPLPPAAATSIGRANCSAPHDTRISRKHITVTCAAETQQQVTVTAHKPVYVQPAGCTSVSTLLLANQTCQLHVGDTVYLLKAGDSYEAGFQLQQQQEQQQQQSHTTLVADTPHDAAATQASQGSLDTLPVEPAAKRHRPSAEATSGTPVAPAAATPVAAAAAPGDAKAHSSPIGPFASTVTAAAQAGATTPSSRRALSPKQQRQRKAQQTHAQQQQPQPQQQGLFAGVCLVDWDGHHTALVLQKAAEVGAVVNPVLDSTTTHVICRHTLTAAEVQRRLSAQAQKQQRQQRQGVTPTKRQQPSTVKGLRQSPQQQAQQQPQQQAHQQSPQQVQKQVQQQDQGSTEAGFDSCVLPPGLQFVTASWLSSSLKSKQRLQEAPFNINLQRQLQPSNSGAHMCLPHTTTAATTPGGGVAATAAAAAVGVSSSPHALATTGVTGSPALSPQQHATLQEQQQQGQQQQGQQQEGQVPGGMVDSQGRVQKLVHKQGSVVPGPAEICPADVPWGTDNRWIEPWDDTAALESMDRLMAHWHQTEFKRSRPTATPTAAAAAAATSPGSGRSTGHSGGRSTGHRAGSASDNDEDALMPFAHQQQSQQQQQQSQQQQGGSGSGGAPCEHIACSQQAFCLVEEMERLKRNYHGRVDQFRIKAASRAINELERLQKPVLGPQDIDALSIGDKSKQKLLEILQTGRLLRNEVLESSELHKTMQLFMTVWGCADNTASKWWTEGCRTLDDVRHKATGLTVIQQMGLRYYEDFLQRIPRAEVEEAVGIIRAATLDVLQGLTGKPRSELDHLLHVRALGSFVRGKPDTGDIDMLLAPGPAAEDVGPGPLAAGLLKRLKDLGYVPEGLSLDHRGAGLEAAARVTWMGVWKGPSSPCFRRLDIKTYERQALPYAVCYFSSGQDCSRAIRYWGNTPTPEVQALAKAIHPAANSFRLSDTGMYVVYSTQLAEAEARRRKHKGPAGGSSPPPAAAAAAAAASGGASPAAAAAAAAAGVDDDAAEDAAAAAGVPVVSSDTTPSGAAGRVECRCETDVFRALGLAYVPPHLRGRG